MTPLQFARLQLKRHRRQVLILAMVLLTGTAVQLLPPLLIRRYLDAESRAGTMLSTTALYAVVGFVLASLLGQFMAVVEGFVSQHLAWTITNDLRLDATRHAIGLDMRYHNSHPPGETVERIEGDIMVLSNFMSRFLVFALSQALLLLGLLIALFGVEWRIGLSLAPLVLVAGIALRVLGRRGQQSFRAFRREATALNGFTSERLEALVDIAGSGAGPFVLRGLGARLRLLATAELRVGIWGSIVLWATSSLIAWTGTACALLWAWHLYGLGEMTIGSVFLVFTYSQLMIGPLDNLATQGQDYQAAATSTQRPLEFLGIPTTRRPGSTHRLGTGASRLEVEDVSFSYSPGRPALEHISLRLEPGASLGVVGRTGSGKSTFGRLIAGLYEPTTGTILLDNVDIAELSGGELARHVAVVPQEVQLFNASLRENLTLFDDDVSDVDLLSAMASLNLMGWVEQLPDGLDTRLGSGGFPLSGGQEQLVAFARVLLRQPSLVLLDEVSSRLDPATERLVRNATGALLEGRTAVVIAHRLSTLEAVDNIVVMKAGRLIEQGDRMALERDESSHYSRLLRSSKDLIAPAEEAGR